MFLSNVQPPSSGWNIKAKREAVRALKMEVVCSAGKTNPVLPIFWDVTV
jgi:hypothetical protein